MCRAEAAGLADVALSLAASGPLDDAVRCGAIANHGAHRRSSSGRGTATGRRRRRPRRVVSRGRPGSSRQRRCSWPRTLEWTGCASGASSTPCAPSCRRRVPSGRHRRSSGVASAGVKSQRVGVRRAGRAGRRAHRISQDSPDRRPRRARRAFWSRARGMVFSATSLPPPPPGRTYQVWVVTKDPAPLSAGLVEPDAQGRVNAVFATPATIAQPIAVAVTLEPAGVYPCPPARKSSSGWSDPPSGLSPLNQDRLPGGASRLAALLVAYKFPICALLAPGHPGAALRHPAPIQRGQATSCAGSDGARSRNPRYAKR